MKKNIDHITSLILKWQKDGSGYADIIREVSEIVIKYPRMHGYCDDDTCCDFYIFFHRRMLKLIENFEYREMSFLSLLRNTLEWQLSSFYRKTKRRESLEYCLKYDSIIQAEAVCDSRGDAGSGTENSLKCKLRLGSERKICSESGIRRFLMLALKSANELEPRHLEAVSAMTGCRKGWLEQAVEELRRRSGRSVERQRSYCERANRAYIELCRLHRELQLCTGDYERKQISARIDIVKKRLANASRGRKAVRLCPTNNDVAEVMGIPKGSIDSGLYLLKKDLEVQDRHEDD